MLNNQQVEGASDEVRGSSPSQQASDAGAGMPPISLPPDFSKYADGFDIVDPVELLFLVDDDIKSGQTVLHPWQIEFMLDFANTDHTKDFPFQAEVRAANGSGKDKYILAACIVWLCMRFKLAQGLATNGSGVQLDFQTEAHVDALCKRVNKFFGMEIWKCNYRYYVCLPTDSPIVLFATDEPNKAEGFHPLKSGGKFAIFASEAKSIPDTIFGALARCVGVTHRIDVSSPGLPMGHFHDRCVTSLSRKNIKDIKKDIVPTDSIEYHITAYDCPHITAFEIENFAKSLPGGKDSPIFKSGVLAEFGTTDEMVVIPYTFINRAVKKPPEWLVEPFNKAGLDLSDGGAETVLLVRNGNKHLKTIPFRFDNTEDTLDFLEEQFKENDLNTPESYVFTDVCGIGKPMANALRRRGWSNIRFIDSRNKSLDPKVYYNRGTELFFHIRILLERGELSVLEDALLIKQLATRYYKITGKNVHQLLTKLEQRSRGYPSPDRADAYNLAFWDYKSTYKEKIPLTESDRPFKRPVIAKPTGTFHQKLITKPFDSPTRRLGKKPDFSIYQEQIDNYNRNLKLTTQTKEN